jgi:exopolyphosphatase
MGNEAADLDSMVAAVAYGYLRNTLHPQNPVLPLIPIPREEFSFRPEAVYLFAEAGLNSHDLIFIDDVDLDTLFKDISLLLVDHNRLSRDYEKYGDQVATILDHHRDEGQYLHCEPRIVQTMGSCCSLVIHEFIRYGIAVPPSLATLLAGTILLDTVNCDAQAGKVRDGDLLALDYVLPHCLITSEKLYENLRFESTNIGDLEMAELLRRDYKEYHCGSICWGISVIPLLIDGLNGKNKDPYLALEEFITERNLDLLLVMLLFSHKSFHRQLMVIWPGAGPAKQLVSALQKDGLGLSAKDSLPWWTKQHRAGINWYEQRNTAVSRKAMQPLVEKFLCTKDDNDVSRN